MEIFPSCQILSCGHFPMRRGKAVEIVAYTGESQKILFPQKFTGVGYTGEPGLTNVGYIGESGLIVVGYTSESRLPSVTYTGESLVQPSRPANPRKGTIP
jgi:hypothetical protein